MRAPSHRHVRFSSVSDRIAASRRSAALCQKRKYALQQATGTDRYSITLTALLDHLIGSRKQFVWDGESERLGGLEIDDQLKFCRHLHGEIGRLLALEDAVDISRRQAKLFAANVAIRDQAARF